MRTYIAHCSDIHIGSIAEGGRSAEYRKVFDTFAARLSDIKDALDVNTQLLVVIAGDIFDRKERYYPEDIEDFKYLMRVLAPYPVLIIPGNHDIIVNNSSRMGLIPPISEYYKNVYYHSAHGPFTWQGVDFYNIDIFNAKKLNRDLAIKLIDEVVDKVVLHHGAVQCLPMSGDDARNLMMCDYARCGNTTTVINQPSQDALNAIKYYREGVAMCDVAKLLILGDIHKHQMVAANAAYCGSLIRQTFGEVENKGFILWDLDARAGKFIEIANEHKFVTVSLDGTDEEIGENLAQMSRPDHIHKVQIDAKSADDPAFLRHRDAILSKFGRIDSIKPRLGGIAGTINPIDANTSTREVMTNHLLAKGHNAELVDEIVEKHMKQLTAHTCRRWHVTAMRWDNLFKYGRGNAIDFTLLSRDNDLPSVAGVIAPNASGKTSIFSTLMFGLFKYKLKGPEFTHKNMRANDYYVRVDFICDGRKYYIERYKSKSHKYINLCEIIDDVSNINIPTTQDNSSVPLPLSPTIKQLTGATTIATYQLIYDLIGTPEAFLSTAMRVRDRDDLIHMTAVERLNRMTLLLGLEKYKSLIDATTRDIKLINTRLGTLVKPAAAASEIAGLIRIKTDELETLKMVQTGCLEKKQSIEGELIKLAVSASCGNADTLHEEYDIANQELSILQKYISEIDMTIGSADIPSVEKKVLSAQMAARYRVIYADCREPISADTLKEQYMRLEAQLPESMPTVDMSMRKNVTTLRIELSTLITQQDDKQKQLDVLIDQRGQLEAVITQQRELSATPQSAFTIENVQNALANAAKVRMNNIEVAVSTAEIDRLKTHIEKLGGLEYGVSCDYCASHKHTFEHDRCEAEVALNIAINKHADKIAENERKRRMLEHLVEREKPLKQLLTIIGQINILDQIIRNIHSAITTKNITITTIDEKIALVDKYSGIVDEVRNLKNRYALRVDYDDAKRELDAAAAYTRYSQHLTRANYITNCADLRARISDLEIQIHKVGQASSSQDSYNILASKKNALETIIHTNATNVGIYMTTIAQLTDQYNIATTYEDVAPALEAEKHKLEIYVATLRDEGLRLSLIRQSITSINSVLNNVLANIVSFRAEIVMEKHITFVIIENGLRVPVVNASEFQEFIIMVCLRVTLTRVLPTAAEFIMIDDGFGKFDAEHLALVPNLFHTIAEYFKFTFLITHRSTMHNMFTSILNIAIGPLTNQIVATESPITDIIVPSNYQAKGPARKQVECAACGVTLKAGSTTNHNKSARHLANVAKQVNVVRELGLK